MSAVKRPGVTGGRKRRDVTGGEPPAGDRSGARLVGLAALAFLLVNYPFLALVDDPARVAGVPLVLAYLFTVWGVLIALAARGSRGR